MNKIFAASLAAIILAATTGLAGCKSQKQSGDDTATDTIAVTQITFNADSAFASIEKQCSFGARVPNSEAHDRCAAYIVAQFKALGLDVTEQKADLKAWDGKVLKSNNIIAAYRPELTDRIIICTHWESRPWADADPDSTKHHQPVMAANDGASGVAVMLEVARHLGELKPNIGIDFICFDSEDYGAPYWAESQAPQDGSDWCLGSQYWAAHPHVPGYKARFGILLDMVGGQDARFAYEGISMRYARDIMVKVWDAATRAKADHLFQTIEGGYAQDDHVPMNETAGIPTIDIIPFIEGEHSFGTTWHTTSDTPQNISKETLRGVGQTLLQFISEQ